MSKFAGLKVIANEEIEGDHYVLATGTGNVVTDIAKASVVHVSPEAFREMTENISGQLAAREE